MNTFRTQFPLLRPLRLLTLLLAALCFSPILSAQTVQILVDDVEAVEDTATHTWYASISQPEAAAVFQLKAVTAQTSAAAETLRLTVDGKAHTNNSVISLDAWAGTHSLTVVNTADGQTLYNGSLVLTTLPLVAINYNPEAVLSKDVPVASTFLIVDPERRTNGSAIFAGHAQLKLRGATSTLYEKKNFALETTDADGEETDFSLFGIRKDSKWILDAMSVDYSRMRNRVCFDLWNELGGLRDEVMARNGTKGLHCEVLLNGRYHGLYCFSDKVNRKLLGLKKTQGKGSAQTPRGLLYKCTRADYPAHFLNISDETRSMDGEEWFDWDMKYPNDLYSPTTWNPLKNLIDAVGGCETNSNAVRQLLADHFYADNIAEYAVFALATMLLDNALHNSYLSVQDMSVEERFWLTPWDLDASLGRDGSARQKNHIAESRLVFQDCLPFRPCYDERVTGFFDLMCAHWKRWRKGVLSKENFNALIDGYADQLISSGAWDRERARWDGQYNFWYDEPILLDKDLRTETGYMKDWYAQNYDYLNLFLFSPPDLQTDEIRHIYTIDGKRLRTKDPARLPHGIYIINGRKYIK